MKHFIQASRPARIALVLGLGILAGCTSDFWDRVSGSESSSQEATAKPMPLIPGHKPATEAQVAEAQALLRAHGFDPGPVDGKAGARTAAAVKAYQKDAGLAADGQVSAGLIERLQAATRSSEVAKAQQRLSALGYDPGPADGRTGPRTEAAVMAFQVASGQPRDGRITPELLAALEGAEAPSTPESVATAAAAATAAGAAAANAEAAAEPVMAAAEEATEAAASDAVQPAAAASEQIAALPPGSGPLAPGDRVLLGYLGIKDRPVELQVGDDGRLALPESGSVQATGLALSELRDRVTVKLIESYMGRVDVKVALAGAEASGDGSKVVSAGDRVLVSLNGDQTGPQEIEVGADGRLGLPDAGAVQAAGLDLAELEEEISVKLLESYMDKLDVRIERAE